MTMRNYEIKTLTRFDCPFDSRLARTPYLVIPKLALQSMPFEWRDRFEAMLKEMDDTGMRCPEYHVFRDDGEGGEYTRARVVNYDSGFVKICGGKPDPWANYKYGDPAELCEDFKRPERGSHFQAKVFADGSFEKIEPNDAVERATETLSSFLQMVAAGEMFLEDLPPETLAGLRAVFDGYERVAAPQGY